jgi:outer membrane murein-binding lipoprotein Lpp
MKKILNIIVVVMFVLGFTAMAQAVTATGERYVQNSVPQQYAQAPQGQYMPYNNDNNNNQNQKQTQKNYKKARDYRAGGVSFDEIMSKIDKISKNVKGIGTRVTKLETAVNGNNTAIDGLTTETSNFAAAVNNKIEGLSEQLNSKLDAGFLRIEQRQYDESKALGNQAFGIALMVGGGLIIMMIFIIVIAVRSSKTKTKVEKIDNSITEVSQDVKDILSKLSAKKKSAKVAETKASKKK